MYFSTKNILKSNHYYTSSLHQVLTTNFLCLSLLKMESWPYPIYPHGIKQDRCTIFTGAVRLGGSNINLYFN
jgi:hypothetical protein